jgi:uncharacterized membrane protein YeaQ/YmgE (transglycosylase-associated protein family)
MIGMALGGFITLLVISVLWSAIVHGAGYRILPGAEGYFAKLIIGWLGGWVGSPVLGYWGGNVPGTNIYMIPAILGSVAAIFISVAIVRAFSAGFLTSTVKPAEPEIRRVA